MNHALSQSPLITRTAIHGRVRKLAHDIIQHYGDDDFLIIGLMNGAFMFLADLCRELPKPVDIAFIKASSYGKSARSSGSVELVGLEKVELQQRRVLLVDDILDTGRTLSYVTECLEKAGAVEVLSCVLLDKQSRHEVPFDSHFKGFVIEDLFVVGYGLDFAEKYRNLPEIWTIRELA